MEGIKVYEKTDFTFDFHELTYGPAVVLTHKDKEYPKYVLKSDEKMDKSGWGKVRHGFHVSVCSHGDPMKSTDYKGLYETTDMEEAILDLINDLNENEKIEALEMEIGPLAYQLTGEIDDLIESMRPFPRSNIGERMENVEIAFTALRARFDEMKEMLFNE